MGGRLPAGNIHLAERKYPEISNLIGLHDVVCSEDVLKQNLQLVKTNLDDLLNCISALQAFE